MVEIDRAKVAAGNELIRAGALTEMRRTTGVSRNHLADMLDSHANHVRKWEIGFYPDIGGVRWLHFTSAMRIADLYQMYTEATEWLHSEDLQWEDVIPLKVAAHSLGISANNMRARLARIGTEPIDFRALGEWVARSEAFACRN